MLYLKIENPGVCPVEGFTLLGATTKNEANANTIGKFGSGNKHGVAVCLRHKVNPIIFCGNLKLEFGTRPTKMVSNGREVEFEKVVVKYGGKDADGKNKSSTEDLGFVLNYGATDWGKIELALREFISNAIDNAIELGEVEFLQNNQHKWTTTAAASAELDEYRKTATDWQNATVEIVSEAQVRAKGGATRIFLPYTGDIANFYQCLGKWFLHFNKEVSLHDTVIAKKPGSSPKPAMIYRRGVLVRIVESGKPSLFDYNIPDLALDECRNANDYTVMHFAGVELANAKANHLIKFLQTFENGTDCWEAGFGTYDLEIKKENYKHWITASQFVGGPSVCLTDTTVHDYILENMGFTPYFTNTAVVDAVQNIGCVQTHLKVLTAERLEGMEYIDPAPNMVKVVDEIWHTLSNLKMTNNAEKPKVSGFRHLNETGSHTFGFYKGGTVYLNADTSGTEVTAQLYQTTLEEIAHHITGAEDFCRAFQEFTFRLATSLMMKPS